MSSSKWLAVFAAACVLVLGLAACGGGDSSSSPSSTSEESSEAGEESGETREEALAGAPPGDRVSSSLEILHQGGQPRRPVPWSRGPSRSMYLGSRSMAMAVYRASI